MSKHNDWIGAAEAFVAGMEAEWNADRQKFWERDAGSERAEAAIATLDGLRARLQKFRVSRPVPRAR